MKNLALYLLLLLVTSTQHQILSQTIPNGDLESWDWIGGWFEDPTGWITMNHQLILSSHKETSACEEEFALRVEPIAGIETIMGSSVLTFPISSIPVQLNFCAKTFIASDANFVDTCSVIISFWNAGNQFYTEEWVNTQSVNDWTEITLQLSQIEPLMDSCKIEIQASFPGVGLGSGSPDTWISVDNLRFDSPNNLTEFEESEELIVYPNPISNGKLNVKSIHNFDSIEIYDLMGNLVFYKDKVVGNQIKLQTNLSNGIYFLKHGDSSKKIIIQQ